MSNLPLKERMKIPRQVMPEQDPLVRNGNFSEVNLGYLEEMAKLEASRCLDCKTHPCVDGCPVGVKINEFIRLLLEGNYVSAAEKIKEDNILPRICSRVCPQEEQCEANCVLGKKGEAVAIGRLARFVTEYESEITKKKKLSGNGFVSEDTGKKVAIIGSGPSGLSCAGDLIRKGHKVTVFEALHEAGGVLVYGIPEFRLPKQIVADEVEGLKKLGVQFKLNTIIGVTDTIDELFEEGYDAIFVGVGAGLPYFLNLPGENLAGIYSANEFLTRVNLMKAYKFPESNTPVYDCVGKTVAVFGGGNTALDSVRTALRLGAKEAYIIYRRSEKEMPARQEEVHHAKDEGVKFLYLSSPTRFIGDERGVLTGVELQKMELGEPDKSGRRRPMPIEGSEYILDTGMAIIAIGNGSNPIIEKTTQDLKFNKWGNIIVDEDTMATSMDGVYAGGDIVTGGATVILAMGAGRKAATAIHQYLIDNG